MEIPKEGKRGEIEGEEERMRERSLLEVAIRGDTEALRQLLHEDEGILNRAMTTTECTGNDNPLHLAAVYGYDEIAREIVSQKRELARGLNSQGQSPLHVASTRGHVGVVKEILSKDAGACFVRDKDGMIPLHAAAIKGRYEVMKELVEANITIAFVLTDKGEPILHLCANYNQFKALKKLVKLVKDDNFLKLKDSNDNTILHLLAHKGEYKAIKFLTKKTSIDVNAENVDYATPLDVSLECGSWRTDWILVGAGAKIGKASHLKEELKVKRNDNQGSWFYEALLVVAVLMITVAVQAGINPPGGVWQDTGLHSNILPPPGGPWKDIGLHTINTSVGAPEPSPLEVQVQHYVGRSIMLSMDPDRYKGFYILNLITFFSSLIVIVLLFFRRVLSFRLIEVTVTILTFLSIMAMSFSAAVSFSFVSAKDLQGKKFFGPSRYIFLVIFLVIFSLPTPLLLRDRPPPPLYFHLPCFKAGWFLKRLVFCERHASNRSGSV